MDEDLSMGSADYDSPVNIDESGQAIPVTTVVRNGDGNLWACGRSYVYDGEIVRRMTKIQPCYDDSIPEGGFTVSKQGILAVTTRGELYAFGNPPESIETKMENSCGHVELPIKVQSVQCTARDDVYCKSEDGDVYMLVLKDETATTLAKTVVFKIKQLKNVQSFYATDDLIAASDEEGKVFTLLGVRNGLKKQGNKAMISAALHRPQKTSAQVTALQGLDIISVYVQSGQILCLEKTGKVYTVTTNETDPNLGSEDDEKYVATELNLPPIAQITAKQDGSVAYEAIDGSVWLSSVNFKLSRKKSEIIEQELYPGGPRVISHPSLRGHKLLFLAKSRAVFVAPYPDDGKVVSIGSSKDGGLGIADSSPQGFKLKVSNLTRVPGFTYIVLKGPMIDKARKKIRRVPFDDEPESKRKRIESNCNSCNQPSRMRSKCCPTMRYCSSWCKKRHWHRVHALECGT